MDLQETWETTFPPSYKADVRGSMRSGKRSVEDHQIPAYSAGDGAPNVPYPPHPRGGGGNPMVAGEGDISSAVVYHPRYEGNRWRSVRDKANPMKDVIKRATILGPALPFSTCDASK